LQKQWTLADAAAFTAWVRSPPPAHQEDLADRLTIVFIFADELFEFFIKSQPRNVAELGDLLTMLK
jgi:hypothetical protein